MVGVGSGPWVRPRPCVAGLGGRALGDASALDISDARRRAVSAPKSAIACTCVGPRPVQARRAVPHAWARMPGRPTRTHSMTTPERDALIHDWNLPDLVPAGGIQF